MLQGRFGLVVCRSSIGWLVSGSVARWVGLLAGRLPVRSPVGWSVGRTVCRIVCWSVGQLIGRSLVGCLVGKGWLNWSVARSVSCFARSFRFGSLSVVDWLVGGWVRRSVGYFVSRPIAGLLVCRSVCWSVGQFAGRLVG